MQIDRGIARSILFEQAAKAMAGYVDQSWIKPIEAISEAAVGQGATHIAFIGTAILAKCVEPTVDVFSVKAKGPRSYSARGLCHAVLVPNAPELDVSLGVTGREPLNNQPYFRIEDRLTRDAPVRNPALLDMVCDFLDRLEAASEEQTRQALRAFIDVRRRHGVRYSRAVGDRVDVNIPDLIANIERLVGEASEGGKRAQAVVAGLMDVFAGEDRVDARRVNDPSRSIPADVNVRAAGAEGWERAFEVRDKPVSREDLYLFVKKCMDFGVPEAIVVAIAPSPDISLLDEARRWAAERGVSLTLFSDWPSLVEQALHWAATPALEGAAEVPGRVEQRLIEVEASEAAVATWQRLIGTDN